ncbi:MAG: hypothetical protein GX127_01860 [Eubacteriaceae bacterium]|jgi:hypothetical protein|nr:hypothetical protein [Eubacteriaceae bacterium]
MFRRSRRKRKNEVIQFIRKDANYDELVMLQELMDERKGEVKKPGLLKRLMGNLVTIAGIAAVAMLDRKRNQKEEEDQPQAVYYYDEDGQFITVQYE